MVIDDNIAVAVAFGPHHLIIEQLGGTELAEEFDRQPASVGRLVGLVERGKPAAG